MTSFNTDEGITQLILAAFPALDGIFMQAILNTYREHSGKNNVEAVLLFSSNVPEISKLKEQLALYIRTISDDITNVKFVFGKVAFLTKPLILQIIDAEQPISIDGICAILDSQNVSYTLRLLKNYLDGLRRSGYISWFRDAKHTTGAYKALERLEHDLAQREQVIRSPLYFITNDSLSRVIAASFPELKGNFLRAIIHIEKKHTPDEKKQILLLFSKPINEETALIDRLNQFISSLDKNITSIGFLSGQSARSTKPLLLRLIKLKQPIISREIYASLEKIKVQFDGRLLKKDLEELEKDGLVIKSGNDAYSVTEKALSTIPHGNFRASSDINRLLELGKRRW